MPRLVTDRTLWRSWKALGTVPGPSLLSQPVGSFLRKKPGVKNTLLHSIMLQLLAHMVTLLVSVPLSIPIPTRLHATISVFPTLIKSVTRGTVTAPCS